MYPGLFGCLEPPRPRFFFKLGVWGTDLHQPLFLETPVRPTLDTPLVAVANRSSSIRKLRISAWQSGIRNAKKISKNHIVYTTSWQLHNHTEHNCCMRLATFSLHPVQNSTTISRSMVRLIDPCVLISPGVTLSIVHIILRMSPTSTRICVPNVVAVRRSCQKKRGVQTDRQTKGSCSCR